MPTLLSEFDLNITASAFVVLDWSNIYGWTIRQGGKGIRWEVDFSRLVKYLKAKDAIKMIHWYYGTDYENTGSMERVRAAQTYSDSRFAVVTKEAKRVPVSLDHSTFRSVAGSIRGSLLRMQPITARASELLYQLATQVDRLQQPVLPVAPVTQHSASDVFTRIFDSIEELRGGIGELSGELLQLEQELARPVQRLKCDFDVEIAFDVFRVMRDYRSFVLFSGDGDYAPLIRWVLEQKKQAIVVFAKGHLGRELGALGETGVPDASVDGGVRLPFLCNVERLRTKISRGGSLEPPRA